MRKLTGVMALVAAVGTAGVAMGEPIRIENFLGPDFIINPGDFRPQVFGDAAPPGFPNGPLSFIHQQVNQTVNTDGWITILSARTTSGLALFALMDRQIGTNGAAGTDSGVRVNTSVNNGSPNGWINEFNASNVNIFIPLNDPSLSNVDFSWNSAADQGNAFAWSDLFVGNNGAFSFFNQFGEGVTNGIQFVSFENGQWVQIAAGDFNPGRATSFDFFVIPLPSAGAMAGAAMLGLAGVTRRRRGC